MKQCEECNREMSRLFPIYDTKVGGYRMLCQKDATQFMKNNPINDI